MFCSAIQDTVTWTESSKVSTHHPTTKIMEADGRGFIPWMKSLNVTVLYLSCVLPYINVKKQMVLFKRT